MQTVPPAKKLKRNFHVHWLLKLGDLFFFAEPPKICRSGKSLARLLFALSEFNIYLSFLTMKQKGYFHSTSELHPKHRFTHSRSYSALLTDRLHCLMSSDFKVGGSLCPCAVLSDLTSVKKIKFMFAGIIRLQPLKKQSKGFSEGEVGPKSRRRLTKKTRVTHFVGLCGFASGLKEGLRFNPLK